MTEQVLEFARESGVRPEPTFVVRGYKPGDEHAIQEMFHVAFGSRPSLEEWRWRWGQGPDGPALVHVLESRGRPVGHIAHAGFPVWVAGRRLRMAQGGWTMVLPEYRGRGGMRFLMGSFLGSEHGFDMRMSFPNETARPLMERYGGGRLLGRMPQWVRWLTRVPRLPRPAGHLATRAVKLWGALASWPRPAVAVGAPEELGEEVDRLAEASAAHAPCIRVRDARYLRWRWLEKPGGRWMLRGARDDSGELRGLIVFGVEGSPSGRLGRIVDLLACDPAALRALLSEAVETLTASGCAKVTCDYLDPRPWARRTLYRAGFLPRPGKNVVCRALSERAGTLPERLDAWYLTRGDTDVS